jgi:lipid-A-disaccharide synthase
MGDRAPLVMISAGEASGDQHAAELYRSLQTKIPGVRGVGLGGSKLREAGVELCYDSSGIGVIGVLEVARHYLEIRRALQRMVRALDEFHPDLLICVDYKEFNFRLAKAAKQRGIRVLFYVSPQVWAWRPGRVKNYGAVIDHMALIFPFELPFYEAHGIPATYVGHPLAGKVKPHLNRAEALFQFQLPKESGAFDIRKTPTIGLLPGSRTNEIKRLLPLILASARKLQSVYPEANFLLFQASSIQDDALTQELKRVDLQNLTIIRGQNYDALQCCHAVITVSGTATLEVALMGVPMVIVYKLSPLSFWLGRLLVKVPYIGLPNILAGKRVVQEFIQDDATPEQVAGEVQKIIQDASYAQGMRESFRSIKTLIGRRNGSLELAKLAASMLGYE